VKAEKVVQLPSKAPFSKPFEFGRERKRDTLDEFLRKN
jgi:hypothetical protein